MPYTIEFSEDFEKSFRKLKKKDKVMFERIRKKLLEMVNHPEHYKPLRNVMAGYVRLHFGSFVVVYKIEDHKVKIISLDHHDDAY